jgi:acyl-CoA thioester hydrolase
VSPPDAVTPVELPVTVEFEDVDSYGIAHHTQLLHYLERARLRLFSRLGVLDSGVLPVLHDLQVPFHRPAHLQDELVVRLEVEGGDAVRLRLRSQVRRGETLLLRARSVIAFWDPRASALAPVPPSVLAGVCGAAPEADHG